MFVVTLAFESDVRMQQAGRGSSQRAGAVSGVISDDLTGQPLAGAVVSIVRSGTGAQRLTLNTTTDVNGRFVFVGLMPGGYILRAGKVGYQERALTPREALDQAGEDLVLPEGKWISEIRIRLSRLGSIEGRITDEVGEPVVGIPVRALERVLVAGRPHLAAGPIAETDDRGVYTIDRLSAGTYFIVVPSVQSTLPLNVAVEPAPEATGDQLARALLTPRGILTGKDQIIVGNYATPPPSIGLKRAAYPIQFFAAMSSIDSASPVVLSQGEQRPGIDFKLQPTPTTEVSGVVVGPPEAISGLVLRLIPKGCEGLGMGSEQATAAVRPDQTFRFVAVPPGDYTIIARRSVAELSKGAPIALGLPQTPGWARGPSTGIPILAAPNGVRLALRAGLGSDDYEGQISVHVESRELTGVVVELKKTVTVSGRVVHESGKLIQGIALAVEPAGGEPLLAVAPRRPRPDDGDEFSITGLKAGQYFLRLAPGVSVVIKSLMVANQDFTDRPIDLTAGNVNGAVVTVTDRAATLSGTVRDSQGRFMALGAVIVFPTDKSLWTTFGFTPAKIRAVTVLGGAFQFSGLSEAEYFVIAVPQRDIEAWQDPQFLSLAERRAERLFVRWGGNHVADLIERQIQR